MNPIAVRRSAGGKLRLMMAVVLLLQIILPLTLVQTAQASSVVSATLSGGVLSGGLLFARQGNVLTLAVQTSADTQCVVVSGALQAQQTSTAAKSNWSFSFTAGAGDGVQNFRVTAYKNKNCNGTSDFQDASYTLDNTGPTLSATITPIANAAGWRRENVSISWSATDAGVGVNGSPSPASDSQQANTSGVTFASTAVDRLGNEGSGSVVIKLDKDAPTISGSRSPAANANGWNNADVTVSFTCTDDLSGVKSCTGSTALSANAANQSASGAAEDHAGNTASVGVGGIHIDKVAPELSGAPTTAPNAAGWYNGDVTIAWTASDALSGIDPATQPANSLISSEGENRTASATVADKAGNTAQATSAPAVKIDKTPPNTTVTAPGNWNNVDVTLNLVANDALSGVAATYFKLDDGAQQAGVMVSISSEGLHTLEYWSVDKAGNVEAAKPVEVKIDRTPPTINHSQAPAANGNGWNMTDVTVTFVCGDSLSGLASCTGPQTVTSEGQNLAVPGTAVDNAGNSATDPASVSIDKTAPTISAAVDRAPNGAGWYNADVVASFACDDELSGIDICPASQTLGEGAGQSATGTATDAAGNSSEAGVSGLSIDKTDPTISGQILTAPSGPGWYNTDVTVHWTCADVISGVAGDCPPDSVVNGEGADLSASATVFDMAGNSANATLTDIPIDRTPPGTQASVPAPLDSGWYAAAVPVTLSGDDNLSGIAQTYYAVDPTGQPAWTQYTGPFTVGGGVHTIYFFSIDNAGNQEDVNLPGHSIVVKVDNVIPTITGSPSPAANTKGWNNSAVTVSFDCDDAESGIATCSSPALLENEGTDQSATGQALDNAGNGASATVSGINIDLVAPTTTDNVTSGWKNSDVAVSLIVVDNLSGVEVTNYAVDDVAQTGTSVLVTAEGSHELKYFSVDNAGNAEAVKTALPIQIDKTAPAITGSRTPDANANGWNNVDVTVTFECSDALSSIASCTEPQTVVEGDNQVASGTATDKAGNSATYTVSPLRVDKTAPGIIWNGGPDAGGLYYFGAVPASPTCTASDALSGPAGCSVAGYSSDVGSHVLTATAQDKAGNSATATRTYSVNGWTIKGFYQPVDMSTGTATVWNTVKGGSTVPLKFELFAGPTELTNTALVQPLKAVLTTCAGNVIDDIEVLATGGTALRYDTTAGQFIYNWQTPKTTGACYKVTVSTTDGGSISANFKMK